MLRYTTIHHDVRERFNLTISEYMVIDSIMQMTKYNEACTQTAVEISKWLGIDERTVRRAKNRGFELGLLEKVPEGIIATGKFIDSVRFSSKPDKMSEKPDKMSEDTIYINKEITSEQSSQELDSSLDDQEETVVPCDDWGEEITPRKKKDTSYRKVFVAIGGTNYPLAWNTNTTQIQAAKNLLAERGLDSVKKAVKWFKDHKDEQFCPQLSTPWEMDNKWDKALDFKYRDR